MQIDHHIRSCPVIREAAGEEPYPQPSVIFATTPSGTVSVEIYDVSVQPHVRLTTTALSGAELTSPTLTGLADNWVLDMGHANVTAVVDCYAREGLEIVVMFQDSGTAASRYVKVTCNDADHIAALYPEQAIYAVANSGNTGTAFPVGSLYLPAEDLGDACTILTARGSMILDCAGSWNGGGSGSGGCRSGDISTHLSAVGALVRTRTTASWYPHVSGEVIDLVDCTVISVNVPYGFALGNFTNGTYFAGSPKLVNCRLQTVYLTGNGLTRAGSGDLTSCKLDGDVFLSSFQSPGCWAFDAVGCINGTSVTVDFSSMGGGQAVWINCAGDWTIDNMAASKAVSMTGVLGMPDITLDSTTNSNITVTATGAYNSVVNNTGGPLTSLTERKLAGYTDLTGNVVNLAAASVTATEAPNLDAAVSTVAATATNIEADTQDIQGRIPAALVSGRIDADVGAMQAGVIAAATIAAGAITAAKVAADAIGATQLAQTAADKILQSVLTGTNATTTNGLGRWIRLIGAAAGINSYADGDGQTQTYVGGFPQRPERVRGFAEGAFPGTIADTDADDLRSEDVRFVVSSPTGAAPSDASLPVNVQGVSE